MLFALGAASSLLDSLQALAASKSSTQSTGSSQTASNPFALSDPAVPSSTPASGTGSSSSISPQTMSALLDAQSQAGTSGAASQSPSQALQNLFSDIDANGDGSISLQEFENALGAGGTNLAAADKVFGELDTNKDGTVSLDELKQALQGAGGHHGHHHHMHASNDSSGNGDGDNTDPLLQALNASLNSNGSTGSNPATSSLTTVDPSQVMPISLSSATYNMIEQMMQRGGQAYATAPLSISV